MNRFLQVPLVGSALRHRFAKFAVVGFSGTLVNLVVLFVCQEYILRSIQPEETRLSFSLASAIFVATINNFSWNRWWTWQDRRGKTKHGVFVQMGQYFLASWLSIALQFVLTKTAARLVHYMVANIIAIVLAAIVTYLLNDVWTFALKRRATTESASRGASNDRRIGNQMT